MPRYLGAQLNTKFTRIACSEIFKNKWKIQPVIVNLIPWRTIDWCLRLQVNTELKETDLIQERHVRVTVYEIWSSGASTFLQFTTTKRLSTCFFCGFSLVFKKVILMSQIGDILLYFEYQNILKMRHFLRTFKLYGLSQQTESERWQNKLPV